MTTNTAAVCAPGYAESVRRVPYAERDRVYLAYGIPRGHRRGYVIDHLVPLEVGGANVPANLWPQLRAEAKVKDRIENEAHAAVCSGRITIQEAQRRFESDWRTAGGGGGPSEEPIREREDVERRARASHAFREQEMGRQTTLVKILAAPT